MTYGVRLRIGDHLIWRRMMIIREPKILNNFSRCECSYRLLDLGGDIYAIEWAPDYEIPYGILYHNQLEALQDFEKLGKKQIGYQEIEARTSVENILHHCPWRSGEEFIRTDRYGNDFWNIVTIRETDEEVRVGPYGDLMEATQNILVDYQRLYGENE
jgi:hypothetical protein